MIFTELRFVFFLLVAFTVHWWLKRNRPRKIWLLACSTVFYGAWDWRFLSLIAFTTLIDYAVARAISGAASAKRKHALLLVSLITNLGVLGLFKYFGFFVDSTCALLTALGFAPNRPALELVLPVGISFYTFQSLSYTIDVYRGTLKPLRSLLDVSLFVAFFPQLVAGPIVRAADFLPQLETTRRFATVPLRRCAALFLVGFVKKACISDNIAPFVDAYFADPARYDTLSACIAVVLYAVQIYCDFSGYTDMALGTSGLFGYNLCENFRFPYFARNISDFWRRWHISLSTWLRDYLYIPLGGNRGSRLFQWRNLMLTMLLGGLWHGAAWTFVVWGGLHGLALVVHREWTRRFGSKGEGSVPARAAAMLATFYFVCVCWIFFRAHTFEAALVTLRAFCLFDAPGTEALSPRLLFLIVALALVHAWSYRRSFIADAERIPKLVFAFGYGAAAALVLAFVNAEATPFIYFQF